MLRYASPGADVHFVNRHRRGEGVALRALVHPGIVAPLVVEIPDDRRGVRRRLMQDAEGVGLIDAVVVVAGPDVKLVVRSFANVRNEAFPDAGQAAVFEWVE